MRINYRKLLNTAFSRAVFTVLIMIIQIVLIVTMFFAFNDYFSYFFIICEIISMCVVLYIININSNPAYKLAWIIPIMLLPIFGGLLYLLFGNKGLSKREKKKVDEITEICLNEMGDYPSYALEKIEKESLEAARQAKYIYNSSMSLPFDNTKTEFFPVGEAMYERMLEELKKAKKFIFLEYFIIEEGKMWNSILEILEEKVKENVDVRVMYDYFGCMIKLPNDYIETLNKKGIRAYAFNKILPVLTSRANNRDHRKICIIDGDIGFTGGINLSDEYINVTHPYGHWLDTGIMLKGRGVWNLTVMFLSLWDMVMRESDDFKLYSPRIDYENEDIKGYVQAFNDSPLDNESTGENVYLNMIYSAKKYLYIMTPYLIIDNEMITALTTAAKSGVDVRLMTPHIPDKKIVFALTRSHYKVLLNAGVKIYEYTPGFVHSKTFVSDDKYGVVGTINLDFRSLYLHFECAVWMYNTNSIMDMKKSFLENQEKSEEITSEWCKNLGLFTRILNVFLKVFAPLM